MSFLTFSEKNKAKKFIIVIAIMAINAYQKTISYLCYGCCRFYPTCSEYAKIAILRFGFFRGIALSFKRLCFCHPWGRSGYDPVPEKLCCTSDDVKYG